MSLHNVRLNNYVKETYNSSVDSISKIYILTESVIGINRLSVVFNVKALWQILFLSCSLLFNCITFYFVLTENRQNITNVVLIFNLMQYLFCTITAVIFCGSLKKLYNDLVEFDKEIRYKYMVNYVSKSNLIQVVIKLTLIVILYIVSHKIEGMKKLSFAMIPIYFSNTIELHYYGHLFNLFSMRIKSIRLLLLSSFPLDNEAYSFFDNKTFKSGGKKSFKTPECNLKVDVHSLLLWYHKIIKMYDIFNAVIKWQLLIILATTFITLLGMTYHSALSFIESNYTWNIAIPEIGLIAIRILPLFESCAGGDKVSAEVSVLRTSLYTRLYKNMFDKNNRRFANSLLALTEARGLTFSVFRMIEINSSLPFKLLELVVTYLVILLQFYKVVNLDHREF